ncbi:MAG: hypothetical protein M3R27_12735 [Bacteroidota bacterium]|nr:hypothetical protein [Bacteroidota bacterium]
MNQEIIAFVLLGIACCYVGYRVFGSIKKKKACGKCVLMDAAKEGQKNKNLLPGK